MDCPSLECLPSTLSTLESLQTLHIYGCDRIHRWPSLSSISGLHYLTNLSDLEINECGALECLPEGCHKATALHTLRIRKCPSLSVTEDGGFPDITTLDHCLPESIQTLTIWEFPRLKSLAGALPKLKNLTRLTVQGCPLVDPKSWS
uniref:CC-NBS-LRR protein n=1 Tax=Kalanchoe fedtschenkoi TaxID=63787 RepID=A0A7N0VLY3_KALFE